VNTDHFSFISIDEPCLFVLSVINMKKANINKRMGRITVSIALQEIPAKIFYLPDLM